MLFCGTAEGPGHRSIGRPLIGRFVLALDSGDAELWSVGGLGNPVAKLQVDPAELYRLPAHWPEILPDLV